MIKVIVILGSVLALIEAQAYYQNRIGHGGAWGGSWGGARGAGYGGGYGGWTGRALARPQYSNYGGGRPSTWAGGYTGGAHFNPNPAVVGRLPVQGVPVQGVHGVIGGQPHVAVAPRPYVQPQAHYGGQYEDNSPKPYSFGYNTVDEYGTQLGRQEQADGSGHVRGSYSYRDPNGQWRQVQYEADPVGGFKAVVDTNEHGVESHRPADAVYNKHQ